MSLRQRLVSARLWIGRGATVLVGTQIATMLGLTVLDLLKRRRRKAKQDPFPTIDAAPVSVDQDQVTVYTFGKDLYEDMLASIASAQHRVQFETYIWKADTIGQAFKEALIAAADRGVDVYVVHDVFANLVVPQEFFDLPDTIHVRRHPLVGSIIPSLRNTGRNHRKLLIVDGTDAYIGGYNIGDTYADRWRDTHARVQGPSAAELENAFVDYWNMKPLGILPRDTTPELDSPRDRAWESRIAVHRNTPRWQVYPIRNMYLEAIDKAAHHIWLTHAYLIPDDDLTGSLFAAVKRGVDVRVIVPAKSNHVVADWLSRGYYDELLRKGIRLFLYQGAMVHAKTATIDGVWSTIGTANLDRLSLVGNYEVNAEFTSAELAAQMERIFATDQENCLEMTLAEWQSRSALAKATEALLAPWRPVF